MGPADGCRPQFAPSLPTLRVVGKDDPGGCVSTQVGRVFLVGSGPGNPELLTLRAARVMQQADVVLYDHLVAPEIVEMARHGAQRFPTTEPRRQTVV